MDSTGFLFRLSVTNGIYGLTLVQYETVTVRGVDGEQLV